jgi:hypothetical protein
MLPFDEKRPRGDDVGVGIEDQQRRHVEAVTGWAEKIRRTLGSVLTVHGDRVHFRPGSKGVAMVGLLPERPQRGKSGLRDLDGVAQGFEALFAEHCRDVPHGRVTGEKSLQSFLISEAYRNGRKLFSINSASKETPDAVELVFVTDEIPLPVEGGKVVCDILALRRDSGRCTPVLVELKDARMLTRLVEQVESYSVLLDEHAEAFEKLYEAVLGEPVRFDDIAERWIIWPSSGRETEPHEEALAEKRIRVVGYAPVGTSYTFKVGIGRPRCSTCQSTDAVIPIIYGEPGPELEERRTRGELILAGCIITGDGRSWHCKRCKNDFGPVVRG